MKTKTNTTHACILTMVLWAVLVSGTSAIAQSDREEFRSEEVINAFLRLQMLMNTVEKSVRYVAPSDEYDDIRSAWESLDMLAIRTESEIRYKVPGIEESLAFELANRKDNMEELESELLSDNTDKILKP